MKNFLKFLTVLLLLISFLFLVSCSDTDKKTNDDSSGNENVKIEDKKEEDKKEEDSSIEKTDVPPDVPMLNIKDKEIPFIAKNGDDETKVYTINLENDEIKSLDSAQLSQDFKSTINDYSLKERSLREGLYWDGNHYPVLTYGLDIPKSEKNHRQWAYFTPNYYAFEKDGVLKAGDINNPQSSNFVVLDFNDFYSENKEYNKDEADVGLLYFEKDLDKVSLVVLEDEGASFIEINGEDIKDTLLTPSDPPEPIFDHFYDFLRVGDVLYGRQKNIDLKNSKIEYVPKNRNTIGREAVKTFNLDLDSGKYDGGPFLGGTYQNYFIRKFEISSGEFPNYIYLIFDVYDLIKIVEYKDGYTFIYDENANLLKEYDKFKFDYMFFPLQNAVDYEFNN